MIQNKAQGLPINILVTLIIGIIIFGLGISMFARISGDGEELIEDLNSKIRTDLQSIECDGEDWICSPNNKVKRGDIEISYIFMTNHDDESSDFQVQIGPVAGETTVTVPNGDCGEIEIIYPDTTFNIQSGSSASVPFRVSAKGALKSPCSFVTTATLLQSSSLDVVAKTSVIVRVE